LPEKTFFGLRGDSNRREYSRCIIAESRIDASRRVPHISPLWEITLCSCNHNGEEMDLRVSTCPAGSPCACHPHALLIRRR
jgi:hypothetical protein